MRSHNEDLPQPLAALRETPVARTLPDTVTQSRSFIHRGPMSAWTAESSAKIFRLPTAGKHPSSVTDERGKDYVRSRASNFEMESA